MLEPWTNELTSSMLPDGICKRIAEEIGADNLLKLAVLVGGSTFYMPQAESILRPLRNQKIKEAYNGYNIPELAERYGVNTLAVRRVSNCLVRDGLVSDPDIWEHLKYLYDMGFIEFTNRKITPDTAYEQDGVARLTTKGVRFIENGGDPESGIDL